MPVDVLGTADGMAPSTAGQTLTFVGNATTVLRLGAFTVLTDPNFLRRGERAYLGKGLWSRRLRDPALDIDELPPLDAVVLSHLHGDHFDRVARRRLTRDVPLLTTPAAARRLSRWGFPAEPLRTWQRRTLERDGERLEVEALPGVHGYGVMKGLLPPVMGSLLEHRAADGTTTRVYVTGDTLPGEHLDEIARRYPQVDAAVVHLGGTRVLFHTVTMDGRMFEHFLRRVRPRRAVPVHYDDYGVMASGLDDARAAARAAGFAERLQVVARGGTVRLAGPVGTPRAPA
jgi:L-ascorbate metabolism protein UlaG (beta-lactamase superfamily)